MSVPLDGEERLRRGVLAVVGLACPGLWCELLLQEHVEVPLQLLPFAVTLAIAASAVSSAVWPSVATRRLGTWVAGFAVLAGAFGCWEHFEHNHAFEEEVHAAAAPNARILAALFGAGPVLAPAVLAMLGALLWLGTRRTGPG